MKRVIIILFLIIAFSILSCTKPIEKQTGPILLDEDPISASLNERFWLKDQQTAHIESEDLTIKLTKVTFAPCPNGTKCIWSGVGVAVAVTKDGEKDEIFIPGENPREIIFEYEFLFFDVSERYAGIEVSKSNN